LFHIEEGDKFILDKINTPGHLPDHLCFLIEETNKKTILSTGDHIIGADSVRIKNILQLINYEQTYFTDYPQYIESLKKV
jgi:glyoxylase-like metal-dependent hydrolase (beta-lactamase superfamily II)